MKNICKKCHDEIGGKSYYIVKLDCINDGEQVTKCDSVILCSDCYHQLDDWLKK